jgi:hypothetical protein
MQEVEFNELEFRNDMDEYIDVFYLDQPFTGVAISKAANGNYGGHYVNGKGHGMFTSYTSNGEKYFEAERLEGKLTGFRRGWNAAGVLYYEEDCMQGIIKRFYPETGNLMYFFQNKKARFYGPGGELAMEVDYFIASPYETYTWFEEVLRKAYVVMFLYPFMEYSLFKWFWHKYENDIELANEILAELLDHENLWVKTTALTIVGERGLNKFRNLVKKAAEDPRTPPSEWNLPDGHGRSASRSIKETALDVLGKLNAL